MGEFAKYNGTTIKIGTCEDMYYLRYSQKDHVMRVPGSLNPKDPDTLKVIRFRFPFPDEDGTQPGEFDNYKRSVPVDGAELPADLEHYRVQFSAPGGYLVCLPCPEGPNPPEGIMRNNYKGRVLLVQQAMRRGWLAPVFQCGGCGAKFSEPDPIAAAKMFAPMRTFAEKCEAVGDVRASFLKEVVKRALADAPKAALA